MWKNGIHPGQAVYFALAPRVTTGALSGWRAIISMVQELPTSHLWRGHLVSVKHNHVLISACASVCVCDWMGGWVFLHRQSGPPLSLNPRG